MAGCGGPPTGMDVARSPKPLPTPAQQRIGAERPEDAILGKLATALNSVSYMEGSVAFKEYARDGGKEEHGDAKFSFRRTPFAARVDIQESNRMLAAGSAVLWTGGETVWVHRKGIPLTLSFAFDNSLVTSIRGWRLDQTDIFSMGRVLLAPDAKVRHLGLQKVGERDRIMFEVTGTRASLPGDTPDKIGLDPRMYVPTYREIYAGSKLVHRGQGRNLTINKKLEDDRFKL